MIFKKYRSIANAALISCIALGWLTFVGCDSTTESVTNESPSEQEGPTQAEVVDDHSGWWCRPHGVPEEECALCKTSLIAEYQAAGDWCDEHNRPDSQCFTCHPENFDKFAARYEAKYGELPPKPTR